MRRYEVRFVTKHGRVVRGPIFGRKYLEPAKDEINKIDNFTVFTMNLNNHFFAIPKEALQHGYMEIKPVGFLYFLIRSWRSR